jgi:hypothetical protein
MRIELAHARFEIPLKLGIGLKALGIELHSLPDVEE